MFSLFPNYFQNANNSHCFSLCLMTNLVQNESLHLACGRMFLTSLPESTDKSKPFKMRVRSQNTPVISHLTLSQSWSPNPSPQCLPLLNPVTPPASFSTPGLSSSHTDLLSYLQRNQAHSSPRTFALPVPSAWRADTPGTLSVLCTTKFLAHSKLSISIFKINVWANKKHASNRRMGIWGSCGRKSSSIEHFPSILS